MSDSRASGDLSDLHYGREEAEYMSGERRLKSLPPKLVTPTQLRGLEGDAEPYDGDNAFVTINSLVSEPDLDTSDSVLLLKMLKMKIARRNDRNAFEDTPVSFKKLIFWVDLNANKGDNVVITPIGKGQNKNLFRDCISMRESGILGEWRRGIVTSRTLSLRS